MKERNGPMDRKIVYLMCENIKHQSVDVNDMIRESPEDAISFIHTQYLDALDQLARESQS